MKLTSHSPLLALIIVITVATALGVILAASVLRAPSADLIALAVYLGLTGGATTLISYLAYRFRVIGRFGSVRWALLAAVGLTVILIFMNIWVTARLMFTSEHDLGLTSLLLLFAGICAVSFGYFISVTFMERINRLVEGVQHLSRGNLAARVKPEGNDELASLASMFNLMAQRLQEADEQKRILEQTRRDLVAWVSHDLRTPLTSTRVMIDAMADNVVTDPQTIKRYFATAQHEIKHLSDLIDDLFDLAQMDADHMPLKLEPSSLSDLLSDTLEAMGARAAERQITLSGEVQEAIDPVAIAPEKIQRVLNNLIGNALRHTPAHGTITVRAFRVNREVWVEVSDSGDGIEAGDLPLIFDRFYRGEKSRGLDDRGVRGAGLGLAIAKALVEAHNGRIWVTSEQGKGATFTFAIPAVR